VVFAIAFGKVVGNRKNKNPRRIEPYLDWMPFLVGIIPLTGLFTQIFVLYRALTGPGTGTGDPRVISGGLLELYAHTAIFCGLFFILLEASFLLRMLYSRYIKELDVVEK
jgi:hypothetical protein